MREDASRISTPAVILDMAFFKSYVQDVSATEELVADATNVPGYSRTAIGEVILERTRSGLADSDSVDEPGGTPPNRGAKRSRVD